jgi:hypothetical protein
MLCEALENILQAGLRFLNGIQVSGSVECHLKMTNFQGEQAQAKREKLLKKNRELIHEDRRRTTHERADTVAISYGVCREILTENLSMRSTAPSSRQRVRPHSL